MDRNSTHIPVILPVFVNAAEEPVLEAVFEDPAWLSAVVKAAGPRPLLAVSNKPQAVQALADLGAQAVFAEPPDMPLPETHYLPPGALHAVETLVNRGLVGPQLPVAIVDYRNPFLASGDVDAGLERWHRSGAEALVTVSAIRDTPVQQAALCDVILADLVMRFGSDAMLAGAIALPEASAAPPMDELRATRPLFFEWSKEVLPPARPGQLYCATFHEASPAYPGLAPLADIVSAASSRTVVVATFLCVDAATAIRVLTQDDMTGLPGDCRGLSFHLAPTLADALLLPEPFPAGPGLGLYCRVRTADQPLTVWAHPVRAGNIDESDQLERCIGPEEQARLREVRGPACTYLGPLLAFPEEPDWDGLVFTIQRAVKSGGHDLLAGVNLPGEPWRIDPVSQERVSTGSGRAILGRQDFPEYVEVEGSLTAGTLSALRSLQQLVEEGRACGHALPAERQFRATEPFDILRLRALRRAKEDA